MVAQTINQSLMEVEHTPPVHKRVRACHRVCCLPRRRLVHRWAVRRSTEACTPAHCAQAWRAWLPSAAAAAGCCHRPLPRIPCNVPPCTNASGHPGTPAPCPNPKADPGYPPRRVWGRDACDGWPGGCCCCCVAAHPRAGQGWHPQLRAASGPRACIPPTHPSQCLWETRPPLPLTTPHSAPAPWLPCSPSIQSRRGCR